MPVDASVLATLRCFETAGRLLNFTRTAEALNLTQSAVSQQIRHLEKRLGFSLFVRQHRGLKLTPCGSVLLESVRIALAELNSTIEQLGRPNKTLQINCLPSLALHWLVPRLASFYQRQPDASVRLTAELRGLDHQAMEGEGIDLAIRYDPAHRHRSLGNDVLMHEYLLPVATPEYLARHPALQARESAEGITFLHDAAPWDGAPEFLEWRLWLESEHPDWLANLPGPQFNLASLMISAALNHQGVALGRTAIVLDELMSGRLVDVFKRYIPAPANYNLIFLQSAEERTAPFRHWIGSEARSFDKLRRQQLPNLSAARRGRSAPEVP